MMALAALSRLQPEQLCRLRETLCRLLSEAAPPGWTEQEKEEAVARAQKWLGAVRARRRAREAALREQAGSDEFTAEERVELFAILSADVQAEVDRAVGLLVAKEISPNEFGQRMERAIWINARAAFIAGKVAMGGPAEVSREGERELRKWGNFQVNRLLRFVAAIKAGKQSDAQIRARAQMYAQAIRAPYNRGESRAHGDLRLPQVPGDGQTACKTNCQCHLRYEPLYNADGAVVAVNVYWELGVAEHCDDCVRLAARWNPLRVEV